MSLRVLGGRLEMTNRRNDQKQSRLGVCSASGSAVAGGLGPQFWRRFELVEDASDAGDAAECFEERDSLALVFQVAGERHGPLHYDGLHSRAAAGTL
jgi:hypothetical protein